MNSSDRMADIEPVRLSLDSKFKFKCHKGVKCFTKCCRDINIVLTPYDIIRLKNRLQLSSEEFLAMYTVPRLLEKTDLPMVTLRLMDDDLKSCPFVTDNGCIIYEDRPTICRYYPLGVASLSHRDGVEDEGFYFFVHEPHCLVGATALARHDDELNGLDRLPVGRHRRLRQRRRRKTHARREHGSQ